MIGFAIGITLIGALILLYRQNRFVPVRFPDGIGINDSADDGDSLGESDGVVPSEGISVGVSGAATDRGVMRLAFYESKASFNNVEQAFLRSTAEISQGTANLLVPLPMVPEKFAIAAFHDENENGVLDRNRFGIPSERYGFSANARGVVGPPSYEESLIDRPALGEAIDISIR